MFYIYIPSDDGSPLFLKSEHSGFANLIVECAEGTAIYQSVDPIYEDSWHESPIHATMFPDSGEAIEYVCNNHPDISSAVEVMSDLDAREYL